MLGVGLVSFLTWENIISYVRPILFWEHPLQDRIIQGQIGHPLLQLRVLFFQVFQLARLGSAHIPIFSAPAIIGLRGDISFSHRFFDAHPLALQNLSFAPYGDDLIGYVSSSFLDIFRLLFTETLLLPGSGFRGQDIDIDIERQIRSIDPLKIKCQFIVRFAEVF